MGTGRLNPNKRNIPIKPSKPMGMLT